MFKITSQQKLCGENVTKHDICLIYSRSSNIESRNLQSTLTLLIILLWLRRTIILLMKNQSARLTSATTIPEVNVVNNHMRGRVQQGRKNGRNRQSTKDKIYGPKNTHQKRGRNNEQAKYGTYMLKIQREMPRLLEHICHTPKHLYQKYRSKPLKLYLSYT